MQPLRLALACVLLATAAFAQDPAWDHQTKTYYPQFEPLVLSSTTGMYVKPYFSPDHSADTHVALIESATEFIDIATPGYDAWIYCTAETSPCGGCPAEQARSDPFPLFGALLNAAHKGIRIRILTNNYGDEDCEGMISGLPFLALNGVEVRYYATTTFLHAKYISVDGKTVSISSVNWSETSYTENREAGVIFQGSSEEVAAYTTNVFDYDWNASLPLQLTQEYNATTMSIITDTAPVKITLPAPFNSTDAYITPKPVAIELTHDTPVTIYASADYARQQVMYDMGNATESLDVMIYQVTDMGICSSLLALSKTEVNVTLVVSYRIYDATDCALANTCYQMLYQSGMTIHKTPEYYDMSHNKFWIMDNKRVSWSTGNWSPSDYPQGASYPPYGQPGWQSINRDFSGTIEHPEVVSVFSTVLAKDMAQGYTWTPTYQVQCGF